MANRTERRLAGSGMRFMVGVALVLSAGFEERSRKDKPYF
jgi:hypothetical protein